MQDRIVLYLTLLTASGLASRDIRSRNLVVPAGQPEGRIIRGNNSSKLQFPYQVRLIIDETDETYELCGGSILNNEWILTAAHCTENAGQIEVILGNYDASDIRDSNRVKYVVTSTNIIIHKNFNSETYENDISLIKIPFTNYTDSIQPVKLPAIGQFPDNYDHQDLIVSGWGDIWECPTKTTELLQWAILNTIPNKICHHILNFNILPSQICTANIGGINVCCGDSGGPLVLKSDHILIGVISFTTEKCMDGPGVYTRISCYLKWIKTFTGICYET